MKERQDQSSPCGLKWGRASAEEICLLNSPSVYDTVRVSLLGSVSGLMQSPHSDNA